MALFQYSAIEKDGKQKRGVIDADSLQVAKERLLAQRILVIKLLPYAHKERSAALKPSDVLDFTRDLVGLLRASLPLYEALVAIAEKYQKHRAHSIFLDLGDKIKQGRALSDALKDHPKSFNSLYIAMVRAGEESGSLESVFEELSQFITRQERLKKQLVSALIYPAFLGAFCLVVLCGLFFFLIPSLQELYEGRVLHPMTQLILSSSQFLRHYALLILFSFSALLLGISLFFRSSKGKLAWKRQLLRVPFLKTAITQSVMIRFCRSFSVLLSSGVEYISALKLSRRVMNHPLFEEVIAEAESQVFQGKKMSEPLSRSALIPPLVSRMLAMAEETGSAAKMLGNIATIYEEDLEKNLGRFTTLLQPVILLVLGVIVGIVLLSVLLPLTDVSSFVT